MEIDHIGYLVKNINKAITSFEELGFYLTSDITHDEIRKTDICFMENGGYIVELVSPYDSESVVANLIKTISNAPYHICYASDDIDKAVKQLENKGFVIVKEKEVAPAFDNRPVVFMFSNRICFTWNYKVGYWGGNFERQI